MGYHLNSDFSSNPKNSVLTFRDDYFELAERAPTPVTHSQCSQLPGRQCVGNAHPRH
jgi:hypothetical protein